MTNWALGGKQGKLINVGTMTLDSTATHTKGSWVQLTSGLDYDIHGFYCFRRSIEYSADFLWDIGLGSTPDIIINNRMECDNNDYRMPKLSGVFIPIFIPKSTEIKGRSQSSYSGGSSVYLEFTGYKGGGFAHPLFSKCYTYGANTGDTGGTLVDPGAVANTYGTWVEFISSLPEDIKGFEIMQSHRSDHAFSTGTSWWMQVGVGASTFEEIIVDGFYYGANHYKDIIMPMSTGFIPIQIPKGTRMTIRNKCDRTSADRYVDHILYCYA